jgi:hypothetical protein
MVPREGQIIENKEVNKTADRESEKKGPKKEGIDLNVDENK